MDDVDGLLSRLNFESREAYDRAKREAEFIRKVEDAMDLTDGKSALKLYNKLVKEKSFSSMVGYEFMFELRRVIIESGVAREDSLAPIPVREIIKLEQDTLEDRALEVERYRRLYEGQRVITTKYKIGILICLIILIGFFVVNIKMEYSVFTYFTNYKATMEEELIDKYQKWSEELKKREDALNNGTVYVPETEEYSGAGESEEASDSEESSESEEESESDESSDGKEE